MQKVPQRAPVRNDRVVNAKGAPQGAFSCNQGAVTNYSTLMAFRSEKACSRRLIMEV